MYTYYVTPEGARKLAKKWVQRKNRSNLADFLLENGGVSIEDYGGDSVLHYDADTGFRVEYGHRHHSVRKQIGLNAAMVTKVAVEVTSHGYKTPAGTYTRDEMVAYIDGDERNATVRVEGTYQQLTCGEIMGFIFDLQRGLKS